MTHIPVLSGEVLDVLTLYPDAVIVDGTANGGGHAEMICTELGKRGVYIGIDLDERALSKAKERLKDVSCTTILEKENYRNLDVVTRKHGFDSVHGVLLDLGMSSNQLELSGRGFSFMRDEPLLMTFKNAHELTEDDLTADKILNTWDEKRIADILYDYGEEKYSRRIARSIVKRRKKKPFHTTFELVTTIEEAVPTGYRKRNIHPATKTFQALRMAVNDEMGALEEGLEKVLHILESHGRLVVISFHSIEDRIVKHFFIQQKKEGQGIIVTKKPITPNKQEIKTNPRARSAKLRVFEKI